MIRSVRIRFASHPTERRHDIRHNSQLCLVGRRVTRAPIACKGAMTA